ncbi:hypothetical protein FQA39_LY10613 [Lamprigera yunnana]|nr:hypothetical protein FQA39_LY10613 [Lamprigera yunnana]
MQIICSSLSQKSYKMPVTQKKKRVSKKSKLSWRKHVDISDVENFFEEKRLEERLGKPIVEKTNDELFILDRSPAVKPTRITSKQKRRMKLRESIPRCFSILGAYTEVPDPVTKRNPVKTMPKSVLSIKKQERKTEIRHKNLSLLKRIQLEKKKLKKPQNLEFIENLWDSEEYAKKGEEWIDEKTKLHTLHGTSQFRKPIPKTVLLKTSIVPAIEPPHPGTSYNPNYRDHQELLKQVVENERKLIKEELHLNRVTTGMFSKVTTKEQEHNLMMEMSQGLVKTEDSDLSDGEYRSINPPVKNKKKALKQRRRHREHLKEQHEIKLRKKQKKKITDIQKINVIETEIDEEAKKQGILKLKRVKMNAYKQKEPKRLSRHKFEDQEIDYNAPDNISGNLRNIAREGSILLDRFKSFERRNILRPSNKYIQKRAKIKRFTRSGHKDDWKKVLSFEKVITINVDPRREDCFYQYIKAGDIIDLEYQVIDGGHGDLDITFSISEPLGRVIHIDVKKSENNHNLRAKQTGDYKFCFDNTFSSYNTKTVFFDLFVENDNYDSNENLDLNVASGVTADQVYNMKVEDIKEVINRVRGHLSKAKHFQDLFKSFEARDRNVVEENYFKVNTFSMVQVALMLTVGLIQVVMVRSLFDDKSRVHNIWKHLGNKR